ncbi:MAG: hypothetical protein KatS3mg003_0433 [Candidatus Nitrosocaldaceae archaeon]|nr:MAG: hypothetical protein KatS3mg003_0433 [Candidatus Nitrosocaldaceae archaeon]
MPERIDTSKPPIKPNEPSKRLTLREFMNGIAISAIDAKTLVDEYSIKLRREVYDKDELMKALPLNTFTISDLEVELKFIVEDVEKKNKEDIIINIDPDKLKPETVSTIRFKLISKPLTEYVVEDKKVLKE